MKQKFNAPWASGPYRALQKLSSKRGPAPRYAPPPEPEMDVGEVIEAVHDYYSKHIPRKIVCVLLHPENYNQVLRAHEQDFYRCRIPPAPSEIFSENPGLPDPWHTLPSTRKHMLYTGAGPVEIRLDPHIQKGHVAVVGEQ